jgi:translation initiation factor IF-1
MSREQDVMAIARVSELAATGADGRGESWVADVDAQMGEHASGRREFVTARRIMCRPSQKMRDSGVHIRSGDEVAVLVNPTQNGHVCVIIRLVRGVTRATWERGR